MSIVEVARAKRTFKHAHRSERRTFIELGEAAFLLVFWSALWCKIHTWYSKQSMLKRLCMKRRNYLGIKRMLPDFQSGAMRRGATAKRLLLSAQASETCGSACLGYALASNNWGKQTHGRAVIEEKFTQCTHAEATYLGGRCRRCSCLTGQR